MGNSRFLMMLFAAGLLLLIPFTAMQISGEVNWSQSDFIAGGLLLFLLVLFVEGTLRIFKTLKLRLLVLTGVLILFVLVWAELAVGVFGTPLAGS